MSLFRIEQDDSSRTLILHLRHKNVLPPVYITSSMSDWAIQEMSYSLQPTNDEAIFEFSKAFFNVTEGRHKYRIRLGVGNHWVVNRNVETVTEDHGILYNVTTVRFDTPRISLAKSPGAPAEDTGLAVMLLDNARGKNFALDTDVKHDVKGDTVAFEIGEKPSDQYTIAANHLHDQLHPIRSSLPHFSTNREDLLPMQRTPDERHHRSETHIIDSAADATWNKGKDALQAVDLNPRNSELSPLVSTTQSLGSQEVDENPNPTVVVESLETNPGDLERPNTLSAAVASTDSGNSAKTSKIGLPQDWFDQLWVVGDFAHSVALGLGVAALIGLVTAIAAWLAFQWPDLELVAS